MIALLTMPLAAAFTTEEAVWPSEAVPVTVAWSGLPDGLDHDETVAALEAAGAAWAEASCGRFDVRFEQQEEPLGLDADGVSALILGDPTDVLDEEVPVTTYVRSIRESVVVEGEDFAAIVEADIVLDELSFAPDAAIDDTCSETWSFQALVTRGLGSLAGLGPTCARTTDCVDPGLEDATMYAASPACDTGGSTLEDDDRLGIRWLYGLGFDATCLPDPVDGMATECTLTGAMAGEVTWDFGDGTTVDGASATHTYAEPGVYVVTACTDIEGCELPSCDRMAVWAVAPGTVTGEAEEDEKAGCGCTTTSWPAGLAATVLSLIAARARRRSD